MDMTRDIVASYPTTARRNGWWTVAPTAASPWNGWPPSAPTSGQRRKITGRRGYGRAAAAGVGSGAVISSSSATATSVDDPGVPAPRLPLPGPEGACGTVRSGGLVCAAFRGGAVRLESRSRAYPASQAANATRWPYSPPGPEPDIGLRHGMLHCRRFRTSNVQRHHHVARLLIRSDSSQRTDMSGRNIVRPGGVRQRRRG
jgi:hypothetical protein